MTSLDAFLNNLSGGGQQPLSAPTAAPRPVARQQPSAAPTAPQAAPVAKGGLDSIVHAFDDLEDPFTKALAKGLVESEMSRALGFRVTIPDPQDLELVAMQRQAQMQNLARENAKNSTDIAIALFDSMPDTMKTAMGVSGMEAAQVIEEQPELFVQIAEQNQVPLRLFDLSLAGKDLVKTEQERRADALKTEQQDIAALEAVAKKAELAPIAEEQAEALATQFEGQGDVSFGSEIDTDKGAETFAGFVSTLLSQGVLSAGSSAQVVLEEHGGNIKDQLEGLDTDDQQNLVVGVGEKVLGVETVSPNATFFLSASILRMANAQGTGTGEVMQQLGLPYAGINRASFDESLERIAAEKGVRPDELLEFAVGSKGYIQLIREQQAQAGG